MASTEIVMIKGEPHYLWPHLFENGNSTRCSGCRYFSENVKQNQPFIKTGQCLSKASEGDQTSIFARKTNSNDQCRWWFPIKPQPGEQEELFHGQKETL